MPNSHQPLKEETITDREKAKARRCLECPVCRPARKKQKGVAFQFVKAIESRLCPYCKAYEKVCGRKAHQPLTDSKRA